VQNRLSKITLICNKGNEDDMAINNWRLKTLCEPVKKKIIIHLFMIKRIIIKNYYTQESC
jgi:hypothetical protein